MRINDFSCVLYNNYYLFVIYRWCWAVFASEERAAEAMKTLIKNPDVFVSKPNSRFRVEEKRQKKMVSRQRKAETRKKLQEMWS